MKHSHFKRNVLHQNGQAVFEFILFLPLFLFLYTIYYTVGNSINGSINQQKAVRGYFYKLLKGNSYVVSLHDLNTLDKVNKIGFNSVGWRAKKGKNGEESGIAPCFKFSSLLQKGLSEDCDTPPSTPEESRFIRSFTFYGVCGPTYEVDTLALTIGNIRSYKIDPSKQVDQDSCTLQ